MSAREFKTSDAINILWITILSFIIRLWLIFHPEGPVFDEVHFGNFTNWYTNSQFYFDIHPPLAKLIMFMMANISEYDGHLPFANCPGRVYPNVSYVQLRVTAACFSAMCGPLTHMAVRFSGFSGAAAVTSAVLVMSDTSHATEGRFILSDGLLHFFVCLHLAVLAYTVSLPRCKKFLLWHVLNGISLGAACSCKNTAWGLMALDGYMYIVYFWPIIKVGFLDYLCEVGLFGFTLLICTVCVYCLTFTIHFLVLPYAGQGYGYLPQELKNQLIQNNVVGSALWASRVVGPGMLKRTARVSMIMHSGNMGIKKFHPSQSRPINWPLLTGIDVSFWSSGGQEVKCHGNVFSYYFALLGVGLVLVALRSSRYLEALRFSVGWAACYFPFFMVPRTMFLYHYIIPLVLGCMAMGVSLDLYLPRKARGVACVIISALAIFGFWLWMPFVYGKYMHDRDMMIWNPAWTRGDSLYKIDRTANR